MSQPAFTHEQLLAAIPAQYAVTFDPFTGRIIIRGENCTVEFPEESILRIEHEKIMASFVTTTGRIDLWKFIPHINTVIK